MEVRFGGIVFLKICSLPTASNFPTFMRKEAQSRKNEGIGTMFISGKFEIHQRLG